ncbi:MAG TPA: hypothetical protein VMW58_04180 [Anaerolineae bacterium]|nr:hypothetical protein [Anaerolineae bacterium]
MDEDSSTEKRMTPLRELWKRLGTPVKIGLVFAIIAGLMALVGWIVRPEYTSRSMLSLFLAVLISAGTWGLVSWAIAAAAVEATREEE